jgi:uncharacterized membrane protein
MKIEPELNLNLTRRKEPARTLALSDGLFATVLTLLVLDLRMPDALTTQGLNAAAFIKWLGPHLFSYALTFLVAGSFWIAHHNNFDRVVRYDRALVAYNLLFLLSVGLLPFSTATLSVGQFHASEFPFFWAIYAANVILAGGLLMLTWNYAASHYLVSADTTHRQSLYFTIRQAVTPAVFLLSILVGYAFPAALLSPYCLLLIPLVMWGVDRYFAVHEPGSSTARSPRSEILWQSGRTLLWLLILGLAVWATIR